MDDDRIEIIGPERAMRTPGLPIGPKHEVVDDELTAPVKDIFLFHAFPWQIAALLAQLVAQASKLLLLCEELFTGLDPLIMRRDFVVLCHCGSSPSYSGLA